MRSTDLIRFAAAALLGHRLRTALSLLGVAIGVAAVVLLTALGEGARGYVVGQFESLGTNLLIVIPGKTETAGALPGIGGAPNDLTLQDAQAILRQVPEARRVVPVVVGTESVSHQERRRSVMIMGSTSEFLEVRRLEVGSGSFLPPLEAGRSMPVVVIGAAVARELFPGENPLGGRVRIGDWRFRVIGVLASKGTQLGVDMDEVVVIPVGTAMRMFDRTSLFRILIDVPSHAELEPAQRKVIRLLADRHQEEDVTVITQDSVLGAFSTILMALTAAVAGIAAISLTVAGIGIMNVMLVSVSERTSEVGLLKALGATDRQVLGAFLTEAVLLAAAGGVVGLLFSTAVTLAISWAYPAFPVRPPWWAVTAALVVSALFGAVFGVLPARRATRLDPVTALSKR